MSNNELVVSIKMEGKKGQLEKVMTDLCDLYPTAVFSKIKPNREDDEFHCYTSVIPRSE